jgi:hypothetical protein
MTTVHVRCWQTRRTVTVRAGDGRTVGWAVNLVLDSHRDQEDRP